jgi:hypothetical protein
MFDEEPSKEPMRSTLIQQRNATYGSQPYTTASQQATNCRPGLRFLASAPSSREAMNPSFAALAVSPIRPLSHLSLDLERNMHALS